jgi:hypothetical protein
MDDDLIYELKEGNAVPLSDLAKKLQKKQYGFATYTFQLHGGKISNIVGHEFDSNKYKQGQTPDAITDILNNFKNKTDSDFSGSLTITTVFNEGDIKKVVFQEGVKDNYEKETR